jgi:site-specific DNA recombinase
MARTPKPAPVADPTRHAVIYARVSSKEQEKEGFSIPAQTRLLKEYAAANRFTIVQEYVDVEPAKQTGRAVFGEMVAYLKSHLSVRVMLVEKTDRLYRNLKDWVTVDELNVELHFPKEGVVLSRESRFSEKFMRGIKVLRTTSTTCWRKRERGCRRTPNRAFGRLADQVPARLSQHYWAGRQEGHRHRSRNCAADRQAVRVVRARRHLAQGSRPQGSCCRPRLPAGGAKVPVSTIHTILRNRLYTGWFEWNGKLIQGRHEALIPVEL